MINVNELRLGNFILQKQNNRITRVACTFQHFELMAKGETASFFPVILKPDILEKCGFIENKKNTNYPEVREFILVLPVMGTNKNELYVYSKSNGECFGRMGVNGSVGSNNFYHLHQLQNLYYALTGEELPVA